ncbi:hypothetical protein THIOSC15_2450004 [uncultured Thiomicrorhabdus sp.]
MSKAVAAVAEKSFPAATHNGNNDGDSKRGYKPTFGSTPAIMEKAMAQELKRVQQRYRQECLHEHSQANPA